MTEPTQVEKIDEASKKPEVKPVTKLVQPLLASNFKIAEFARQNYVVVTPDTPEAVLNKGYWRNVAAKLRPFDRIEVVHEAGEWMMDLFVKAADRHTVLVTKINFVQLEGLEEIEMPDNYYVKYRGNAKYCVMRREDTGEDTVLFKDLQTKRQAQDRLISYYNQVG